MCYKTFLALLLVAISVNADYVTHVGSKLVCEPCGPEPNPHVYFAPNFTVDAAKGTWRLVFTNDMPAESNAECITWSIYPNNDTVGNINVCWNDPKATWWNLICGRANGGGFVTYPQPDLSYSVIQWESDRWPIPRKYFVMTFQDNLWILVRCDTKVTTVKDKTGNRTVTEGIQYVYVLTRDGEASTALANIVTPILTFNSMNPRIIGMKSCYHGWGYCNYINNQW